MIPNDLTPFTVEQLRGFATLVDNEIGSLRTKFSTTEGAREAADVDRFDSLADDKIRIADAIALALDAEGEGDDEEATAGDAEATEADAATEGDGEGDKDGDDAAGEGDDADTAVDEAVAAAQMGGDAPRITNEPRGSYDPEQVRAFLRNTAGGKLTAGSRTQFASLKRETNHVAQRGANITDLLPQILADRVSGSDKTAAGCFCGPDDARNEIAQALVSDRPFSDTLPTITGGDFRFIRQIDLAAAAAGVTIWDCDDQAAVVAATPGTWKPCFDLDCQTEITSETYAVPACATFDTQAMIGNPALIANLEHVMTVAYNRIAELEAYNRVVAQASQVTYNASAPLTGYGASAKLLKAVAWAMSSIRATHRDKLPYDLVLPAGLRERVLVDGQIRGIDDYRVWNDLLDRLEALGVRNVVELFDPTLPANALPAPGGPAVEATQQPLAQQILLYRPENFLLGVGPEIDLGVVASGINELRQNRMNWFVESFESVTRVGIQPTVAITADFCDSGIRPALGEGDDCTVEG